jgi:hypothetical protein
MLFPFPHSPIPLFPHSPFGIQPLAPALTCRRLGAGWGWGLRLALRTAAPVDDFGLVDLVALVVDGGETGGRAGRAVDVDHAAATPANQVVVVVADPILEACRRPGRLDAPNQTFGHEHTERVVHRLQRDRADLGADGLGHGVGRDVRLPPHCTQHRQPLGGYLDPALTKPLSRVNHTG